MDFEDLQDKINNSVVLYIYKHFNMCGRQKMYYFYPFSATKSYFALGIGTSVLTIDF